MVGDTPTLLAIFAHPDDETFRPGGTLALLARHGVGVHVLTATRGQAGSRGDPALYTQEELPAVRERELRCACAALGVAPPRLLDYQDGLLAQADPEEITAHILTAVTEVHPVEAAHSQGGPSVGCLVRRRNHCRPTDSRDGLGA